jgi:two-component system, OmpR family, sensor histidine kinase KdpD
MMNWIRHLHEGVKLRSRIPSATIKMNLVPTRTLSFGRKYSRAAVSVLVIALLTLISYRLHINNATIVLFYLLVLVQQSLTGEAVASVIVAIFTAGCLDFFFLPPPLSFRVDNAVDAWALLVFPITALVVTRQVTRVRLEALRAHRHGAEVERLYSIARRLLVLRPDQVGGIPALEVFRDVSEAAAVCVFDAGTAEVSIDGISKHDLAERTRQAYIFGKDTDDVSCGVFVRCLRIGSAITGAVGFEGVPHPETISPAFPVLAATALERAHAFRVVSDETAATKAEVFRTAILDALAHEFKTPIATILAVVGALRESERLEAEELEMAGIIESETARLSTLTERLLQLARLDREEVRPRIKSTNILALVEPIANRYASQFSERRISVSCPSPCIKAPADRELLDLAITQLLDNALKYSIPDSAVTLQITKEEESVMIRVRNEEGNFIAPGEQERIFERFYRGTDVRKLISGAGLGLYVARKIVVAHGGSLVLDKSTSAGTVVFSVKLPMSTNESYHASINI